MIDYDSASQTYDHTREASGEIIARLTRRVPLHRDAVVLDFGCGTGSYLDAVQKGYGCRCCGVEPAAGMRAIARSKNDKLDIKKGNHSLIPFHSGTFDLAFLVDVVHHVPDLVQMFGELGRVLKGSGRVCVVTESHLQIDARFYNIYFPSLAVSEKKRYPALSVIIKGAWGAGLSHEISEIVPKSSPAVITRRFIQTVAEKNYSMFRLLAEPEYQAGLKQIESDKGRQFDCPNAGQTLLWFRK